PGAVIPTSTRPSSRRTYRLSLHDALPISVSTPYAGKSQLETKKPTGILSVPDRKLSELAKKPFHHASPAAVFHTEPAAAARFCRSEEHTSELQSRENLVCRLLLEKKNRKK